MPVTPSPAGNRRPPHLIDLALQGGGAHGAFTWGVLDRLLERSRGFGSRPSPAPRQVP
jgi:NTE family protein